MPVFNQLCRVAREAQEQQLISPPLVDRICAIGRNRLHYKHLGLELYSLVDLLVPACAQSFAPEPVEELVQHIETRHRRL
jgi:hypothetical protein